MKIGEFEFPFHNEGVHIVDANGICAGEWSYDEANAPRIVAILNGHTELLAAAKDVLFKYGRLTLAGEDLKAVLRLLKTVDACSE